MRWDVIITAFSDVQVRIIIITLLSCCVIGAGLLAHDFAARKRKRDRSLTNSTDDSRITQLRNGLAEASSTQEKLVLIDSIAKELFVEQFGVDSVKGYSDLVSYFQDQQQYDIGVFCQRMFEAYYSDEGLTSSAIDELVVMLIRILRRHPATLEDSSPTADGSSSIPAVQSSDSRKTAPKSMNKEHVAMTARQHHLRRMEELIAEKKAMLEEQERLVRLREKDLSHKEIENARLLTDIEKQLKLQERKVREQERLQKRIEKQLDREKQQQSKLEKSVARKKELEEAWRLKKLQEHWTEDVTVSSIPGRVWIESHEGSANKRKRKSISAKNSQKSSRLKKKKK